MSELKVNGYDRKVSPIAEEHADLFEEIEVPVPWGFVSGKWWGPRNKQPILAIHGWQDNAGTWDTLIPLLPRDMAVFCIDLPGHGRSSHYPPGMYYYIFWDGISLIRRIVKYFKWENITLLGHSLGGALSFMYAASFPDDVDRYISIDIASPTVRKTSSIVAASGDSIDKFLKYDNLTKDMVPSYGIEEMINILHSAYKGSVTKESSRILMKRVITPSTLEGYHFSRDVRLKISVLGMLSIEQVLEYATQLKCKVLNIRANPGMDWDNPSYYTMVLDKIRETAASLVCTEIQGTHHVHLNEPEKVVPIILEFLRL